MWVLINSMALFLAIKAASVVNWGRKLADTTNTISEAIWQSHGQSQETSHTKTVSTCHTGFLKASQANLKEYKEGLQNYKNPEDVCGAAKCTKESPKLPKPLRIREGDRLLPWRAQGSTERSASGRQKGFRERCWQRMEKEIGFLANSFLLTLLRKGNRQFLLPTTSLAHKEMT